MPKEITHWTIAEKISHQLSEPFPLKKIIGKNKNIYYLGAVILDSPFYCLFGRNCRQIIAIGQQLHDPSQHSYLPVYFLLNEYLPEIPEPVWAFAAGIMAHINVDAHFHPFINYFSGDKKNPRQCQQVKYRHRLIESMLDLFYLDQIKLLNQGLFKISISQKEVNDQTFYEMLSIIYFGQEKSNLKTIKRILANHMWIQNLFRKKWPQWLLKFVNLVPGIQTKNELALFYPDFSPISPPFFVQPFSYYHPLTEIKHHESISDLEQKSINKCIEVLGQLYDHYQHNPRKDIFPLLKGPNLNTGLIDSRYREMHLFDPSQPIDQLIFHGQR